MPGVSVLEPERHESFTRGAHALRHARRALDERRLSRGAGLLAATSNHPPLRACTGATVGLTSSPMRETGSSSTSRPPAETPPVGNRPPPGSQLIEVRVADLRQLFNAMDPSPFRTRDLDPDAEEFIVGWAREAATAAPLALLVHLDRGAGSSDEPRLLQEAIAEYFRERAETTRRRLRELFRVGRISLAIGVVFLAALTVAGHLVSRAMGQSGVAVVLRESASIGGWVAMWRPLEVFLYDWWPIRREARLYDRLSAMPVRIDYARGARPDAWRADWPAARPQPDVRPPPVA